MKKIFLFQFILIVFSFNLLANPLTRIINQESQSNHIDENAVDNLIAILKDPNQVNALIEILEGKKEEVASLNLQEENQSTVEKIEVLNSKLGEIILIYYKKIQGIEIYNTFENLKNEIFFIKDISYLETIKWILWLLGSISFSLILEFFLSKRLYSLKDYLNTKPFVKQAKAFLLKDITFFIISTGKLLVPLFVPILISIIMVIAFFNDVYYVQIVHMLLLFLFIRILILCINIIFYKTIDVIATNFQALLIRYLYIIFFFLVVHNLLIQNNAVILPKLNLLLVSLLFFIIFLKARASIFSVITNRLKLEKAYIYAYIQLKKHIKTIVFVLTFYIVFLLVFIDYGYLTSILISFFFSINGLLILYFLQRLANYLFKAKVVDKIQEDLTILSNKKKELNYVYKLFDITKFWVFFNYIYKVIVFLIFIFLLDSIWHLKVFNVLKTLLSTPIADFFVQIIIAIIILMTITLSLIIVIQYYTLKHYTSYNKNIHKVFTLYILCKKPYKLFMAVVMIIVVISAMGVSITTLLASTGILTLLIGFGAKDTINNFFNAIIFLLEDSLSLNDFVEIAGVMGTVEDMSMLYIKLRDLEGKLHMVPFSSVDVITNYNKEFGYAFIEVGISYESDINKAKEVLQEIAKGLREDKDYQASILDGLELTGVTKLDDFSVNIRCRLKTLANKRLYVKAEFLQRIKEGFDKNNIDIPYPHRTIVNKV